MIGNRKTHSLKVVVQIPSPYPILPKGWGVNFPWTTMLIWIILNWKQALFYTSISKENLEKQFSRYVLIVVAVLSSYITIVVIFISVEILKAWTGKSFMRVVYNGVIIFLFLNCLMYGIYSQLSNINYYQLDKNQNIFFSFSLLVLLLLI